MRLSARRLGMRDATSTGHLPTQTQPATPTAFSLRCLLCCDSRSRHRTPLNHLCLLHLPACLCTAPHFFASFCSSACNNRATRRRRQAGGRNSPFSHRTNATYISNTSGISALSHYSNRFVARRYDLDSHTADDARQNCDNAGRRQRCLLSLFTSTWAE